jgi:hypothetical protein
LLRGELTGGRLLRSGDPGNRSRNYCFSEEFDRDRRLAMKRLLVMLILTVVLTPTSQAGNTSSNSSSNSSNGVHTRVDTIITDNGRGRTIYERRSVRIDADRGRPTYMRNSVRERYGYRSMRGWHRDGDDD